jgi:MOSC domain-containing protein YiiM
VNDELPTIASIHIAKARRLEMRSVDSVVAEEGKGLVGDRYHGARHRHVTVQSAEALAEASVVLGREVTPAGTRRNLTLSHGTVPTTPGSRLRIGEVLLEVVRVAAPCKLLDDGLGPGAMASLRHGRAGAVCRLLSGGVITLGDAVELVG